MDYIAYSVSKKEGNYKDLRNLLHLFDFLDDGSGDL